MTITEDAVRRITASLRKDPKAEEQFIMEPMKRRALMERLLDTECGAEITENMIRFDLGCAQPVIPYAELENAVLESIRGKAQDGR